jgi:hypothetical protein
MNISSISNWNTSLTAASNGPDPSLEPVTGVLYSQKSDGETYSTHILRFGNNYEARIDDLPGAAVIDSTYNHAEKSLGNLISFFA